MTRTVIIVGLATMLFVAVGGPGLSISPASAAEMMEADKMMMKATGEDLMVLKNEIAIIRAELSKLTARIGTMNRMVERASSNYCQSVPQSLKAAGFAPGLCR